MLISNGTLMPTHPSALADTSPMFAYPQYYATSGIPLVGHWAAYGELYRLQLWVGIVIRKLAWGLARLPLDLKRQLDLNDQQPELGPLGALLARPNDRISAFALWLWTSSTFDTYGEAHWLKLRDPSGRVRELWPIHPTNLVYRIDDVLGPVWDYVVGGRAYGIAHWPVSEVVSFVGYNPDNLVRGLSNLESLRETLANEDAARRATSSFWRRGARPSVAITHPGELSEGAQARIEKKWEASHAGADLMGGTAILEEGMTVNKISLDMEEMQYIESRKLNREECCAAYDTSPLVVHILDRATYSNVTEQLRSQYRDTMAPRCSFFESVMNHQLVPDFYSSDEALSIFSRFNMDEVLRGTFETRVTAAGGLIQYGISTPAEARPMFGLPKSNDPAADLLYANAALQPLGARPAAPQTSTDGEPIPQAVVAAKAPASLGTGVSAMVAVYPTAAQAAAIAVDGGEDPGELHVTLAYLGQDLAQPTLDAVSAIVAAAAAQHETLAGSVGGLGQFPAGPDGTPHYAPVDVPGLTELAATIRTQLAAAGVEIPSDHGYTPHMTLVYGDADTPAPDPLQPIAVTFDAIAVVVGGAATRYPLRAPLPGSENVRSVVNVRAIARRVGRVKAAAGDVRAALVDEHEKALASLFLEQANAITADPHTDLAAYDDALATILVDLGLATSKAMGETVAVQLGGTYDPERIAAWIRDDAGAAAHAINATVGDDLAHALDGRGADLSESDAAAAFALGLAGRATSIANSRVSRVGGLAEQVAAEQSGAASKTWLAGANARDSHAGLDGETVPLGETFSNGMNGPGDPAGGPDEVAGCNCSLSFDMP